MGMGGSADVASNTVMAKQADGGKREIKPAWTKIYGKTVDVSKFRHPGGNIIELFYGMDATTAFEAFHGHHKGAFKMLRSLPVKEVDPADQLLGEGQRSSGEGLQEEKVSRGAASLAA